MSDSADSANETGRTFVRPGLWLANNDWLFGRDVLGDAERKDHQPTDLESNTCLPEEVGQV